MKLWKTQVPNMPTVLGFLELWPAWAASLRETNLRHSRVHFGSRRLVTIGRADLKVNHLHFGQDFDLDL